MTEQPQETVRPQENVRVVRWERTQTTYPSEWRGTLADGRAIYIRYRLGVFRYAIGADPQSALLRTLETRTRSFPRGQDGGAFLADSEVIAEMRKFGVSFENAVRIGEACEKW
jgi:hypothetical protein